jgi:hypothetical protein
MRRAVRTVVAGRGFFDIKFILEHGARIVAKRPGRADAV